MVDLTGRGIDSPTRGEVQRMIDGSIPSSVQVPDASRFSTGVVVWTGSGWVTQNVIDNLKSQTRIRELDGSFVQGSADRARIASNANQSIAASSLTTVTFAVTQFDSNSLVSGSTLVCKKAGAYNLWGQVQWNNTSATNLRLVRLHVNGVEVARDLRSPSSSGDCAQQVVSVNQLAVNDVVSLVAFQDTAGAVLIISGACYLAASLISI